MGHARADRRDHGGLLRRRLRHGSRGRPQAGRQAGDPRRRRLDRHRNRHIDPRAVTASVRPVRTILVAVASLALASVGCKDKPTKKAPPANVGSAGAGSGSGPRPAPDLILPRADGTPPKKTAKPLERAEFEKLTQLEF